MELCLSCTNPSKWDLATWEGTLDYNTSNDHQVTYLIQHIQVWCVYFCCSYSAQEQKLSCFGVVYAEARHLWDVQPGYCNIFKPHLALPVHVGTSTTRSHAALHILGEEPSGKGESLVQGALILKLDKMYPLPG